VFWYALEMPKKLSEIDVLKVFRWRSHGMAVSELAKRFTVARSHIYSVLAGRARADVEPANPLREKCRRKMQQGIAKRTKWAKASDALDCAVRRYLGGFSLRSAAAGFGMSVATLHRELNKRGIRRRPRSTPGRPPGQTSPGPRTIVGEDALAVAVAWYEGGSSLRAAAEPLGVSVAKLRRELIRQGIKRRKATKPSPALKKAKQNAKRKANAGK
jgi:transposase